MKILTIRENSMLQAAILFFSVFIPALLIVILVSVGNYRREIRAETTLIEKNEELLIGFERTLIANQLNGVLEDVKYLAGDPSLDMEDYVSFLERKHIYAELRIINIDGSERARLEYRSGTALVVADENLEDVSGRRYYRQAAKLPAETIYVSRLELGEAAFGRDEPLIWFAAPLAGLAGGIDGILVLKYRANEIIRRAKEASAISFGHAMVLDPDGYWIHSHREEDQWGFAHPGKADRTFARDYPDTWQTITKMDVGITRNFDATFIFTTVYPLLDPHMELPPLMWKVVHDYGGEEGYYWYLVSYVPRTMVLARTADSRSQIVSSGLMFGIGFFVFSIILAVMRRKRLLAESRIAEEASIFAHNPAPVLKADSDGYISKANPAAHLAFIGDSITDQSIDIFSALDAEAISGIKHGHSYQFEQKLGESYYYFSAKRDPGDGSLLFYGSDITSRKEIQKEILRLSTAVEQSATAILIADLDGYITFANTACAKSSGYTIDELVGTHTRALKSGEQGPAVYKELWATIGAGLVWAGEMHNRRKDGSLYWEEMSITPVRDDTGSVSGYLAVKEDITRRKETEEQLTRAKEEAESASRLKSEFLANMSHEIRTPMNAILGFTDFLIDDEKVPNRLKNLRIIKNSGKHLLSLINDILDFSKIEADRVDIQVAPFAFRGLLEHIEGLMRESIRSKGLYLRTELDPGVPAVVEGDEHRITQILLNVLGNAVKFTDSGGITIRCSYYEGVAAIAVSDTGLGIEKNKLEEIFNPFQQANASTERTHGGTGLGLAICRRLADLMKGRIDVESTPGSGSTFSLKVPLHEIDDADVELLEAVDDQEGEEEALAPPTETDGKMVSEWLRGAGSDDKMKMVVLRGIRDLPVKLAKLKASVAESDIKEFSNIAHDLKGYSGNLHLTEAYEAADRLYARVRSEEFSLDDAPDLLAELESIVGKIPASVLEEDSEPDYLIESLTVPIRILTAEDNETNQELIRILLEGIGLESDYVTDGKAVLARLEQQTYDLLLLDMQMPVMDGHETALAIRRDDRYRDLHVIAITAHAMEGDADKYLEIGCDDYMSKPIDRALFAKKVTAVMDRQSGSTEFRGGRATLPAGQRGELGDLVQALRENVAVFNPGSVLEIGSKLREISDDPVIQAAAEKLSNAARDSDHSCVSLVLETLASL